MSKKRQGLSSKALFWREMREETSQAVLAILSFLLTLLSLLAAFGKAGYIGQLGYTLFSHLFGYGYFLIPVAFALLGIALIQGVEKKWKSAKAVGIIIFFLSGLGLLHIAIANSGGIVGKLVAGPLVRVLDVWASVILLSALIIVSLFIVFEAELSLKNIAIWRKKDKQAIKNKHEADKQAEMDSAEEAAIADAVAKTNAMAAKPDIQGSKGAKAAKNPQEDDDFAAMPARKARSSKPYNPPPLALLERDRGKAETGDIKANANIIKRTLQNFGIVVEMDEISIGPSVTRYALKPAEGIKLSRITALNNDLSLALAAHPIRIEAPIPGKSLVGIEVPNTAKTTVGLATILGSPEFQGSDKPLLTSLGKDITGRPHFCNLDKAPHMLIAGATGSGKSVSIHALITSLLYRNSPEDMKLIMIDPKRVELTLYNKIPHLLTPVITDPKKAIIALKWAGKEMSRRYDVLEKSSARDITSYHKLLSSGAKLEETMPYIVIVIDELADIMQSYPRELESAIVRLAQMSRAVGIHLVISTQRPSVNVITGLIKANIPTRVALQVASQIDSRTILDQPGAEKLLGAGDMLYLGSEMSKPVRLQSAFITESEVKKVVKYLATEYKDELPSEITLTAPDANAADTNTPGGPVAIGTQFESPIDLDSASLEDEDEMYEPAKEAVIAAGKASTSYIQRKLGIGYSRAAKLMDMLEERGVIGAQNGSRPREVIGAVSQSESSDSPDDAPSI